MIRTIPSITAASSPRDESGFTLVEVIMALFLLSIATLAYVSIEVMQYKSRQIDFQRRLVLSRVKLKVSELSLKNPKLDPDLETTTSPITSYAQYHTESQTYGGIEYKIYWCVRTEEDVMNSSPGGWSSSTPTKTLWVNVFAEWTSFHAGHRAQMLTFAVPDS